MFKDGFPNDLSEDVAIVDNLIPHETYYNVGISTSQQTIQYSQNNVVIKFPDRIYNVDFPEKNFNKLNLQQKMIVHCIYTRSCDGFVREKHLKSLLLMEYPDWAIPYIVKLCDEYIIEILEVAYDILKEQDTQKIKKFCLENIQSFCKSYARMTSYWNEFYRDRCCNFHEYIGKKLFRECFGYSRALDRKK